MTNEWEEEGLLKRGLPEWILIAATIVTVGGLLALVLWHVYADILLRLAPIFGGR